MITHRYTFEKYNGPGSKHTCPQCKKTGVFTRYVDTKTGMIVHPSVGRCDRESNCGYHYTPKDYFKDNDISIDPIRSGQLKRRLQLRKAPSHISSDLMESTLKGYKRNNFANFLITLFDQEETDKVLKKYFVGTADFWPGSTIFWQVDIKGKARTGKIILYNPETGKRVKAPFNHVTWVHSVLKLPDYELRQCLFGEHLLTESSMPVAIVESEKTAIIASIYLPQFTWLATGGLLNLTAKRCQALSGRTIVLFPDLKAYDKWGLKAKEISELMPGTRFEISDLLEKNASDQEKEEGYDVADYLIQNPWKASTEAEKILDLFIVKNPNLGKLIEVFDLAIDESQPKSK